MGRNFLILLDADEAGVKSKDEYIDKFGDIVKGNIVTYEDLVPSIEKHVMEDIFDADEKLTITQLGNSTLTKYHKKTFNMAIQNLLITNTKITLSEQTKTKFSSLLTKLNRYQYK